MKYSGYLQKCREEEEARAMARTIFWGVIIVLMLCLVLVFKGNIEAARREKQDRSDDLCRAHYPECIVEEKR